MNRLFKPLLITIAFLICTGVGWGQTYDTIGNVAVNDNISLNDSTRFIQDTSILHYVAVSGDAIITVHSFFRSGEAGKPNKMEVGLYEWVTNGDSAGARAYIDTIVGSGTTSGAWDSVTGLSWTLTAGKEYALAERPIGLDGVGDLTVVGRSTSAGGTQSRTIKDGYLVLPDPFDWSPTPTATTTAYSIWGLVENTAVATPLSVGPTTIGVTKLAPPQ